MVDKQIQSYRISFELTKPNQSGFVGNMMLIICFLCQPRLDPEFVERVHMNVWHQRRTANHEPWLKVKRLKNMINLNAFTVKKVLVHERGQIKEIGERLKHERSHVAIFKALSIDSTAYLYYIWSVYINIHLK